MTDDIAWHRLARDGAPALEWVEVGATSEASSVLFVHGASAGAWMWSERFLPAFARAGHHAAAVSLRGHGGSEGREALSGVSLADLGEDLRFALSRFARPPVVVAHSLGGLLAQRLVGGVPMRALVLLASLPPEGMAFLSPRLVWSEPAIWTEALMSALSGRRTPVARATDGLMRDEGIGREAAHRYAGLMVPESWQALLEAHVPQPVVPAALAGLPTLVLAGGRDPLVWRSETLRTAIYHGATHETVPEGGHFLQLGEEAPGAARRILDWLASRAR